MAIQMRRGLRADFDPTKLVAGEWAVSVDSSTQNQIVWMCFGAGVVKRMGTYEDFQAMIAEISEDLEADFETELRASVNTILSEVQSLADDVSDDADAVATARTAIESTDIPAIEALVTQAQTYASNADTSAQSASSSAQSASNSASSASSSATSAESSKNTASAKATEAQSWAIGGTGTRSGEDTNNAKYWSERAQSTSLAQSDWTENDTTSSSYINHKPFKTVGAGLSVDSNGALNVSNPGTTNYNDLSNKPSINGIALSGNKTLHELGAQAEGNYLEDGDVPSWALSPTKPSYTASEVGALPANTPIPSKTSDLQNDSGFITDIALATSNTAGKVKPDNTSITVDANGTLSVIGGGGSGDVSYEELNVLGAKNLLGNNATTTVVNGVTFTVNADGSVNANGTASADISFTLNSDVDIPSGDYKLSGCPEGGNANTYSLVLTDTTASTSTVCTGADASVTINSAHTYTASISIKSGTSVSNKLYKPMIRLASITDDTYTPYAMTNQALTKETTNLTQQLTADNGQTFQYGYDSTSGKYGYYVKEAGTDVFVPFSTGGFKSIELTSYAFAWYNAQIGYPLAKGMKINIDDSTSLTFNAFTLSPSGAATVFTSPYFSVYMSTTAIRIDAITNIYIDGVLLQASQSQTLSGGTGATATITI